MNLLQKMIYTLGFELERLKDPYYELVICHGLITALPLPAEMTIALDHEETENDQQYELAGHRKRTHVFIADIYVVNQEQRSGLIEAVKDLFEDKSIAIIDIDKQETGVMMTCEGVSGKVNLEQPLAVRMKIRFSILIN